MSNFFLTNTLKAIKKIYGVIGLSNVEVGRNWKMFSNKEYANELIYKYLTSERPCMITRFGSTELACLVNYLGVKQGKRDYVNYIKGKSLPWWWNHSIINQMQQWSGFFPANEHSVERFGEVMLAEMTQVDVLGSWLLEERYFNERLVNAKRLMLEDLEPFFVNNAWTRALTGKKVLVVHPFAETIERQYKKRELLFDNNLLPDFDLKTIMAVQTIAGAKSNFVDWFEALQFMKNQIDAVDYDICIIGAGAYGFPLAAHVKHRGKKAIHLGGVTQLLFGIKGRRII
jgi:hypothetical protein